MEQIFSSLHTHTIFDDGKDDVETMCRTACEKGLVAIGFSAHAPIKMESDWHLQAVRMEEYLAAVHAARRRWEGKIDVYLGFEVDYIKGQRSPLDRDIRDANPDYTIGSVHYLLPPQGYPFTVDAPADELKIGVTECYGSDGEAMMHAYWDAVAQMLAIGGFDIIGHLDLVKKHNRSNCWFDMESDAYRQRLEEIVRAVASGGFVLEVNTGALNRGQLTETYPSLPALRLLRQLNVPVMISADAHCAAHLDGHYREACQILLDAGYTNHVIFQGRKDEKAVWRELEL